MNEQSTAKPPAEAETEAAALKQKIIAYCQKRGALAVGVADTDVLERISPPGHGPRSMMPKLKSVIALGVGGSTQGAWHADAKTLSFIGDTETRAYKVAYGLAFYIEQALGRRAIFCPPDMDPEQGARVPLQSMKLHAEVAGIGARSLAGDILLHPEFGYMYFASVFTELELPPNRPMAENPCPHSSCVEMYRQVGQTPCMKFCPVQCLSGTIDEAGRQSEMHYDMAKCAELSEQYESLPLILAEAMRAETPEEQESVLMDPDNSMLWYKMSVGSGGLLAQCFECMRVCPIATRAPLADPIRRAEAAAEDGET